MKINENLITSKKVKHFNLENLKSHHIFGVILLINLKNLKLLLLPFLQFNVKTIMKDMK